MNADIKFGPAKAVNAGGVGVSGLEMSRIVLALLGRGSSPRTA